MEFQLSIITINYNNAEGLQKTFDSVRKQTFKQIDYLVIDGGSNDGSKNIIRANEDLLSFFVSEKDQGIYDAQNKGIQKSRGSHLIFLNSGDIFAEDDFLEHAILFLNENAKGLFVYCDTVLKNGDASFYKVMQPAQLSLFYFYKKTLNHQSCIIPREYFSIYGLYDLRYKICADFDFILKIFVTDTSRFVHFSRFAVIYDNNGLSAAPQNYDLIVSERQNIIRKYLSNQQIVDCIKEQKRLNSWRVNLKNMFYDNKLSYSVIKFYVKIRGELLKSRAQRRDNRHDKD